MRTTIENVYQVLKRELSEDNKGKITFKLADVEIVVKQNNVVGNIVEEWLDRWLIEHDFDHIYNHGQCSPDFWFNPDDLNKDWCEVKSFTGGANFDIANYMSYITEIIEKPWKLDSKYLCVKYTMNENTGIVAIDNVWLKNVWEISSPSGKWAVKVQDKKGVIYNLRPSGLGTTNGKFKVFSTLEHFLSALDYVVKTYPPTSERGLRFRAKVERIYSEYKGVDIHIPLWQDIASQYNWHEE